jgi:hypothetical protein
VALAISKATYAQAIGEPPGQLVAATPVDCFSPPTMPASIETATHEHPAVLGAGYDVDTAQTTIKDDRQGEHPDRFDLQMAGQGRLGDCRAGDLAAVY